MHQKLIQTTNKQKIELPPKLIPVFNGPARYRGAYGGRGSGKTRTFAVMAAVRALMYAQAGVSGLILCGREFQNTLEESSFAEVKFAIQSTAWLLPYFDLGEKYIRTKCRRVHFSFQGLRRNIDSIKSKARILILWVDEAEPVSEECWIKVIPTVRESGSEIWLTWNPETDGSPTDLRFKKDPPRNSKIVEINFVDNPWFYQTALNDERLDDEEKRPETYPHIWLGGYLEDQKGALWNRRILNHSRVDQIPERQDFWFTRIVVGVDPATKKKDGSDETGIVVAGLGTDGHLYILADYSGRYTPAEWAKKCSEAYYRWQADMIIAESNQGGEMVKHTVKSYDQNVNIKIIHASRGKQARAEPISAFFEDGTAHMVGRHRRLETQMCTWVPITGNESPDRLDAMVWAATACKLGNDIFDSKKLAGFY